MITERQFGERMVLRLLGPLELVVGRRLLDIGGPRQRVVLAMLALNANRVTPVSQLVEALWGLAPPSTARGQIQTCISSLRKLFGEGGHPGAIRTRPPGYLLEIASSDLDSDEFARLVASGRTKAGEGRLAEASSMLSEALTMWRGPALAGVESDLVRRCATPFEDHRLVAIEERVRLDLALGRHKEISGELAALNEEWPLREQLSVFRMLALYRSGRQADALEVGRRTRATLVEQLGIEPGPELQKLETAILNRDPELDLPMVSVMSSLPTTTEIGTGSAGDIAELHVAADVQVVPHLLPASNADFTGRDSQINEIKQILFDAEGPATAAYAVRIVAISGRGGVGKSSLAIRVAHEISDAFPDGQLYGDLRNPDGEAPTAELLARFLHALGVSGRGMPEGMRERAELYRSLLANKRVLVVLDDAASEEQVLPLLPGSPTCAVITTSRIRLSGLSGAFWVDVDVFDTDRSMELLAKIVGDDRVRTEQGAAIELVELCGGLPLALRIAGARLASRPHWQIGGLVQRLKDEARTLDEFTYRGVGLRFNIDLTYRSLSPQAKRLFRLFALVRAPDLPEWTAAALLDTSLNEAVEILESLVDVRLLDIVEYPGKRIRYRFHHLIRIYALEQLIKTETRAERDQALARALGGWLALTEEAHRQVYGGDYTILHGTALRWRLPERENFFPTDGPMEWWDAERSALVAAVRQAAEAGLDELCWDLALTSVTLFEAKGYFDDWHEAAQLGLRVTESAGNRAGQAAMLYSLGTLYMFQKRLDTAEQCLTSALKTFETDGNVHGSALVLRNIALVDHMVGNFNAMLTKYTHALELMRAVGDRMGEAQILRSIASFRIDRGETDLAREMLDTALAICRDVQCLRGEAQVLDRFAYLYLSTGHIELAGEQLNRVLGMVGKIGDRIGEAYALYGLGVIRHRLGQLDSAKAILVQALWFAKRVGERLIEGQALCALGEISLARGRRQVGVAHVLAASQLFEQLGSTLWHARTLILLAEVSADDGDYVLSERLVEQARKLLSGLDSNDTPQWVALLDKADAVPRADSAS